MKEVKILYNTNWNAYGTNGTKQDAKKLQKEQHTIQMGEIRRCTCHSVECVRKIFSTISFNAGFSVSIGVL